MAAPILVLGLGNLLLQDDGAGLELLKRLEDRCAGRPGFEFIDGGTQGLALVPCLAHRRGLLILDAVQLGAPPGTVHVISEPLPKAGRMGSTAHESNAASLLGAASLIGECPDVTLVVGIEPAIIRTGVGLSETVCAALDEATIAAEEALWHISRRVEDLEAACTR